MELSLLLCDEGSLFQGHYLSFKCQYSVDKRVSMKSPSTVDFSDWLASTDIEFNSDTTGNM
jgi:hypothetical protein